MLSKTVVFESLGGPEVLAVLDRETSPPAPNEVQVRMRAAGLNRAEYMFMAGEYLVEPALPSRIGIEGAGHIEAVGEDVSGFKPGDEVFVVPSFSPRDYGVLSELANLPSESLVAKPPWLAFEPAAAVLVPFLTAWY
ncbi:MAG: alcohol dehydrogenase catalytic domain-containing protein, partial [Myxococcota bacterium]